MRTELIGGLAIALALLGGTACGGDDDGGSASGPDDFCGFVKQVDENDAFADDLGDEAMGDPTKMEEAMKELQDAMEGMVDRAPDAIKGEVETLAEYFGKFDDLLADNDYDFSKIIAAATEDSDLMAFFDDTAKIDEATKKINTYVKDECGIDLEADEDTATTTG